MFGGEAFKGLDTFFVLAVFIFFPLAVWKIIDIVIWLTQHIRLEYK